MYLLQCLQQLLPVLRWLPAVVNHKHSGICECCSQRCEGSSVAARPAEQYSVPLPLLQHIVDVADMGPVLPACIAGAFHFL